MTQSYLDALFTEPKPLTVSQLTAQIRQQLETRFPSVWLEGEISNFVKHTSGHWYFTLKDAGAQIDACCFKMANRYIRFRPTNGLAVRARGRLSVYEPRGRYQVVVETLEPVGIGALQLAFDQLKEQLEREGLFEPYRKRSLPLVPRKVGIVTSPTGAAIRDMLKVLKRRNRSVQVLIAPARVQGDGAAAEIVAAIKQLNARDDIDVIIVGRGGGSLEDLWCFNEEAVARAIFTSRIPIISAVGHEIDFTIADFVADLRAPTPSAAAEQVAMARDELEARLRGVNTDLVRALQFKLLSSRARVSDLQNSRGFALIRDRVHNLSQQVDDARNRLEQTLAAQLNQARTRWVNATLRLSSIDLRHRQAQVRSNLCLLEARLHTAMRTRVETSNQALCLAAGKLAALSPLTVLARGYAIARDSKGRLIKRAADVPTGERIQIRVADGEFQAICE